MRKVYCKGNVRKPNEWKHMAVIVFFLNMNCFSQVRFRTFLSDVGRFSAVRMKVFAFVMSALTARQFLPP